MVWRRASRHADGTGPLATALRGRLGGSGLGGSRFEAQGEIDLRGH